MFSTANAIESNIFWIELDKESVYPQHEADIARVAEAIEAENKSGWKALPDIKVCSECPIKNSCPSFTDVPTIYKISVTK